MSDLTWLTATWRGDRAKIAAAYRNLLGEDNASGRLILADLARYCHVGRTSFTPGDPHATAFNEGARDVFCHIAQLAGLKPTDFPEILARSE